MTFSPNSSQPMVQSGKRRMEFPEFEEQWQFLDQLHVEPISPPAALKQNNSHPPIIQDDDGAWHILDFELAQKILDGPVGKRPANDREWQHSNEPQPQKKPSQSPETSKWYTLLKEMFSKDITAGCQEEMKAYANDAVRQMKGLGIADLSHVSLNLSAIGVAHLIGLNPLSDRPRNDFFRQIKKYIALSKPGYRRNYFISKWFNQLSKRHVQRLFLNKELFPVLDPKHVGRPVDLISTLKTQGYSPQEIATTALNFIVFGVKPTQQFINNAFLYLMRSPNLKESYLTSAESERHKILQEILRIEPIIDNIVRISQEPIELTFNQEKFVIPANATIFINIYHMNQDSRAVGVNPRYIDPTRIPDISIPLDAMSFGYGAYRCPADQLAIFACDILLSKLLAYPTLRIKYRPNINHSTPTGSFEIESLIVTTI